MPFDTSVSPARKPLKRIDAHHHLWRYTAEEYDWIDDTMDPLRRDFLPAEFDVEMRSAGVDGAVTVEARQTVEETRWLLDLAEQHTAICGVVGWLPIADPAFPGILDDMLSARQPHAARHLKGLRHGVQAEPGGFLDGEAFNRGIRAMLGSGLVFDLLIRGYQLAEGTRFVDRHRRQPFVLDHMGKPSIRDGDLQPWSEALRELARRPNVCCKISGMVTEADWHAWKAEQLQPYFEVALEAFGPDRLMIGSDWPVLSLGSTYGRWWSTVEGWIERLSPSEQRSILGETATEVYALTVPTVPDGHQAETRNPRL